MASSSPPEGPERRRASGAGVEAITVSVELLRRARDGNRDAAETLCRRHGPRLRRWAHGRLPAWARDLLDTDDVVQETLMQTLKPTGARFEPRHDGALQAYLREALQNRIRMEIRRLRRRPAAGPVQDDAADPGPSPLDEVVGRQAVERYEAALAELRPDDREAVLLRIEMGYSYQQVAEALNRASANAARMAVVRALMRLAEKLRDGR